MVMRDVEEPPDTGRLYTPMLTAGCGVRLALFRDRHGESCAVGFTSAQALEQVLGTTRYEAWPLARSVVRELADARGVRRVLVDPVFAAAGVSDGEPAQTAVETPARAARPAEHAPSAKSASTALGAHATHYAHRVDPQVAGALAVCAVVGAAAVFLGELR
jgi:hypothetical protein